MSTRPNFCDLVGYDVLPTTESWQWRLVIVLERVFAFLFLIGCVPLLAIACAVTVFLSRRSPLIAHRRIGQNGREFWVLKLRTMWSEQVRERRHFSFIEYVGDDTVPDNKDKCDPRVTSPFAAFCRKYSIDELPQLWLVVRGEMSMVGPRPMIHGELLKYYGPDAARIIQVKPGLTGLWQIKGRSTLSYQQRRRLDLFMLKRWSLGLYAVILIASVPKVLSGKDAW